MCDDNFVNLCKFIINYSIHIHVTLWKSAKCEYNSYAMNVILVTAE